MTTEKQPGACPMDVILRPVDGGDDIPLQGELRIGRERECEIWLDDKHISRYHARLSVTPEGITLEDLRSTNGTYVNGSLIHGSQGVSLGDELRFHQQVFRLVSAQAEDSEATVFGWPLANGPQSEPPAEPPPVSFPAPAPPVRVEAAGRPERVEPEGRPERIEPEGQPEHIETEAKPERIEPRLDPGGVPPLAQERQEPSLQPVRPQPQPRPEAATERPDPFSMRAADAKQRESQDQQALEEEQAARRERRKRPSAIERQARKLEATVERVDLDDVRQLAPGTWLELVDGQGDKLVCCKISEGLGAQQQFYFVSRRGFGEFAMSSENLARQLADGRARTRAKGPLVGRLMLRLAGVLRRDEEAADDPSPPEA